MNFIKRLFLYAVFALSLNHLFADKQIGLVPSSVKNESDIFQVGVLENNIPVLVVKEEREGFVSTITEYFVIYGKEKIGPFDGAYFLTFSPDSKTLSFEAKVDRKWYFFVGKEKIGPFDYVGYPEFSPDSETLSFTARSRIDVKWYLFVGKEKIGPFDYVYHPTFSPDSKTFGFEAEVDGKWYKKVFFNSQTYTGSICGNKVVYIKDGKIMLKD